MLKHKKIKDLATVHASSILEKAAFAAAFGVTGVALCLAIKVYKMSKDKIDLTLNDIDWYSE